MIVEPNDPRERRREWRLAGIICFALITAIVLWATWMIIRPFIDAIILGAVLVTITFPTYRRVRTRLNGRDGLAATIMIIGITLLIILPAVIIGHGELQADGAVVVAANLRLLRRWIVEGTGRTVDEAVARCVRP